MTAVYRTGASAQYRPLQGLETPGPVGPRLAMISSLPCEGLARAEQGAGQSPPLFFNSLVVAKPLIITKAAATRDCWIVRVERSSGAPWDHGESMQSVLADRRYCRCLAVISNRIIRELQHAAGAIAGAEGLGKYRRRDNGQRSLDRQKRFHVCISFETLWEESAKCVGLFLPIDDKRLVSNNVSVSVD